MKKVTILQTTRLFKLPLFSFLFHVKQKKDDTLIPYDIHYKQYF